MTSRYQVRIKNQQGQQVGLVTDESPDFVSFYCTHMKNAPGMCRFEVDGRLATLFEPDGQIELLRVDPEFGITELYTEWEGFHVTPGRQTLLDGSKRFISNGVEYLDLVRREEMGYFTGTTFTDKTGPGESVIKAFVNENIGPAAIGDQRVDVSAMPGLTIQTDFKRGKTWKGARAWRPLIQNLQEVAQATGLAFNILGVGPAQFEFRVYDQRLGADRTIEGLDIVSGLNRSGYKPVVFSTDLGNMLEPSVQGNAGDVINIVYVLGQGVESERNVAVVKNNDSLLASPWNRRVESRNAVQEDSIEGLLAVGQAVLEERKPRTVLTFTPVKTTGCVYGLHYFFGDLITAIYEELQFDLEIVQTDLTVNKDGETLRLTFA